MVRHLLQLGAKPSVRDQRGQSLLFVWAYADRPDLIIAALKANNEWATLQDKIDVWERDPEGLTLLEVVSVMDNAHWYRVSSVLHELQRHWIQQERPIQRELLLVCTTLIGDLADIALSFVDGLDHRSQPLRSGPAA